MGDFDRDAGRSSSGRGRYDRPSGRFGRKDRGGGRDRGGFGGSGRGGDRVGFDRGDGDRGGYGNRGRDRRTERHEMHEAVCDKCGKDCEVPFRPTEGKPIYCDDCFKSKSREAGSRSEFGKPINNDMHEQIISKLDKILRLLESKKESVEEQPKVKKQKNTSELKKENIVEKKEPELEYAADIEKKKPKKKKAKKKKD